MVSASSTCALISFKVKGSSPFCAWCGRCI
nr:MAG TPA: hypothetical protein [Caudoviricetes sp.]